MLRRKLCVPIQQPFERVQLRAATPGLCPERTRPTYSAVSQTVQATAQWLPILRLACPSPRNLPHHKMARERGPGLLDIRTDMDMVQEMPLQPGRNRRSLSASGAKKARIMNLGTRSRNPKNPKGRCPEKEILQEKKAYRERRVYRRSHLRNQPPDLS